MHTVLVNRLMNVGEVAEVELEEASRLLLVQAKQQAVRVEREIGRFPQRAVVLRIWASGKRSWGMFRAAAEGCGEQWTLQTASSAGEGNALREVLLAVCNASQAEKKCAQWAVECMKL